VVLAQLVSVWRTSENPYTVVGDQFHSSNIFLRCDLSLGDNIRGSSVEYSLKIKKLWLCSLLVG